MKTVILVLAFYFLGVLGILHHYLVSGRWFDWKDLYHHEPIIAILFALGIYESVKQRRVK